MNWGIQGGKLNAGRGQSWGKVSWGWDAIAFYLSSLDTRLIAEHAQQLSPGLCSGHTSGRRDRQLKVES